jgi:hypothetical protein
MRHSCRDPDKAGLHGKSAAQSAILPRYRFAGRWAANRLARLPDFAHTRLRTVCTQHLTRAMACGAATASMLQRAAAASDDGDAMTRTAQQPMLGMANQRPAMIPKPGTHRSIDPARKAGTRRETPFLPYRAYWATPLGRACRAARLFFV